MEPKKGEGGADKGNRPGKVGAVGKKEIAIGVANTEGRAGGHQVGLKRQAVALARQMPRPGQEMDLASRALVLQVWPLSQRSWRLFRWVCEVKAIHNNTKMLFAFFTLSQKKKMYTGAFQKLLTSLSSQLMERGLAY